MVKDGRLVSALASERLYGKRKWHGVTSELIDYVCSAAGILARDIDLVALSDYHPDYVHGAVEVRSPGESSIAPETWNRVFGNEVSQYDVTLRGRLIPGFHIAHHMCHCAAAFYTSPFTESACFSMDASGGALDSIGMTAHGSGTSIVAMTKEVCAVGQAYNSFVEWLGLGPGIFKAGSLMAWASYANPLDHVMANLDRHADESIFSRPDRIDYRSWIDRLWEEVAHRSHFEWNGYDFDAGKAIAASMQAIFEASVLRSIERIDIVSENLCLGGGSFLNCCANSRVLRDSRFAKVHLFPAATDDGCSVGAALYVAHHLMSESRCEYRLGDLCYLGHPVDAVPVDHERVAECIADGGIVAWAHGRSEFGPRALGSRSLLADPRRSDLREQINAPEMKAREWFRPVCPSVLEERSPAWFDHPVPSPYMLFTAKATKPELVPGVVHADGTARHQDVRADETPDLYQTIEAFNIKTGVPMIANTSLNGPMEPIVESRRDARDFFYSHPNVKMLVLHGIIEVR